MEVIKVPDVPGPVGVCWKQGPTMERCTLGRGHAGPHQWERATVTRRAFLAAVAPVVSKFLLPLDLRYLDGHNWQVLDAFTFGSVTLARTIEIPIGFVTDFASIPRVLWNVLPPTGQYGKAAVVHDFLYRTPRMATREEADNVLAEAMIDLGVGWFTRAIIFRGVRVGGGSSYHGSAFGAAT
jgi:hypothetical protein